MFVDEVIITVQAGKGGDGCISFRREKFIPKGGPDGGDGGRGGSVYIQADSQIRTLIEFYRNPYHKAKNGERGNSQKRNGKNGSDLILKVPIGTMVEDVKNNIILADLTYLGEKICVAYGGSGGKGNYRFRNSVLQAPRFAQKGEPGEERTVKLNLKLIADAALIGLPNVGKSTLLSRMSGAKPKIADYPFTTLEPNLGVVYVDEEKQYILADIPGLIEGAFRGAGLGTRFLKHIERTKIIVHIIDGSRMYSEDIMKDYITIKNELNQFSLSLKNKKEIIVVNKCDLPEVKKNISRIRNIFSREGKKIFLISAMTGEGVKELVSYIFDTINSIKKEEKPSYLTSQRGVYHYEYKPKYVIKKEENKFVIESVYINKLVNQYDLDNPQALKYFQEKIKSLGLEKALRKKGAKEGDMVRIGSKEFYFYSQ